MKRFIRPPFVLVLALLFATACEQPFTYDPSEIPGDFVGLSAPAADSGYQIHVPAFPIPADFEREWFMRLPIGNTQDIYVDRFVARCRPGTHHLIAYGFEDENAPGLPPMGVMRDQNRNDGRGNIRGTMSGTLAYFISQSADFELAMPAGTAIRIPANSSVDMNSHYFNKTDNTQFGEVYLNAYTVPQSAVQKVLIIDDVDNVDLLVLPPRQVTTIAYTEIFEQPKDLRMLVSHMHKRGKQFDVYFVGGARDGELIYSANDYKHPETLFFTPAMRIEAGQGLRTVIRYDNETNRTIKFGVTSEDEMGIAFYMYSQI
jgi:Copper type II ascorbate-dependent monooxygenase, C-terminal domain